MFYWQSLEQREDMDHSAMEGKERERQGKKREGGKDSGRKGRTEEGRDKIDMPGQASEAYNMNSE